MTTSTSRPASAGLDRLALARPERREAEQLVQRLAGIGRARDRLGRRRAEARERDVVHGRRHGRATIPPRPEGNPAPCGDLQRSCCEPRAGGAARWRERERVLERVLGLRGGRPGERIVAGEARVAVRLARALDRLVDAAERQVGQRVAAQLGGDLGLRAPVGDHLLARGHVDAVVARVADRRRRDPHVDLARARVAQHLHDLARRVAAHDRVVDDDQPLAADHLGQRVELHPQAVLAQLLAGLDERARDVAVLDQPVVLREPAGAREAARGRVAGVRHRDHEVGVDRRLARRGSRPSARARPAAPGRRAASPGARSRCARTRTARGARRSTAWRTCRPPSRQRDDLARLHVAQEASRR